MIVATERAVAFLDEILCSVAGFVASLQRVPLTGFDALLLCLHFFPPFVMLTIVSILCTA